MKMPASRVAKAPRPWHEFVGAPEAFIRVYMFEPNERVKLVKEGLPARVVVGISDSMSIPKDKLYTTLGLARATINRKVRDKKLLNQDESERVLGIIRLIGQALTMVTESGDPKAFDVVKWIAVWLEEPQPALGGKRPAELMDTAEGRAMVSDHLARMQSGAYA